MDALESFAHIDDSVPSWLSKLDELSASVAEHNARFLEMARFGIRLLKTKNASTESLQEGSDQHYAMEGETADKATDIYVPPNPSHQCLSHASRTRHAANNSNLVRKRKGSNASILSGQPRYRTKTMVVVYYDSAVQESFESLFRSIAGARNNLRKGKTTALFKSRMASLGMEGSSYPIAEEPRLLNPKTMRAGLARRTIGPGFNVDGKMSTFDAADKDLEITQRLCEAAAHQCLRDGDCRPEIESMRKRFEACRAIATREIERLKEEEAREKTKMEVTTESVQEEKLPVVICVEAKVNPPPPLRQINFSGTGVIEIDDGSDAESIHIDLSVFKTRTGRI